MAAMCGAFVGGTVNLSSGHAAEPETVPARTQTRARLSDGPLSGLPVLHWGDSTVLAACVFGMVLATIQVTLTIYGSRYALLTPIFRHPAQACDCALRLCAHTVAPQVWILWTPTWYVMKGRKLKVSLRHTEVLVLLLIGVFVVVVMQGNVFEFRAFKS